MDARAGQRSLKRRIEPLLGPAAAVLLALAAAFFCFAMPASLVGRLIDLHTIGGRLPLMLVVALLVGGMTWAGFAWSDRRALPRTEHLGAPEGEADDTPMLRWADAHPDAPPCRPIFAGADLGTPLDLIDPLPADWQGEETASAPHPGVLPENAGPEPVPDPVSPPEQAREPEPEPVFAPEAEQEPVELPRMFPSPRAVAERPRYAPLPPLGPREPLPAMMARLEAALARRALLIAGAEPNVTVLHREIRPVAGTLTDAVEELRQRTAARR